MAIKLERISPIPYGVTYIQSNGNAINYIWTGAKPYARNIVEVDEEVYNWLKFSTQCFQNKSLIVVDEEQKEDMKFILSEEELKAPVYTLAEIESLLKGSTKELKTVVEKLTEEQISEFITIAKQMKLDSSSKRSVLAKALKMPVEIIFSEED